MALRHEFPLCSLGDVDFSEEKMVPVRALRAPVDVGFRNGADLEIVAATVHANRVVNLVAACGSGKSVRVPLHLAKAMNMLVIHSVPAANLSQSLEAYVTTTTDQQVAVLTDVDTDMPTRGVVLISNAVLIARMLSDRRGFKTKYILFMDESHESDCFTAVLRRIGPTQVAAERFVTATATSGPDGFRARETPGGVSRLVFDDIPAVEWDVESTNMPWSVSRFNGNVVIFVEQKAAIRHLTRAYTENGVNVYVLNSRSSFEEHSAAMRALKDEYTGINVLLVDYSYRSGFTITDVCHWIDNGKVVYHDVDDTGNPVKRYRNAYKFEMEQAAGRAGRIVGTTTTVAQPRIEVEAKICDLEGVELDAAALVYRLFGMRPPAEFRSSPFSSGKVPRDPVDALRSPIPLRCIPRDQLVDWADCQPGSVPKRLESIGDMSYANTRRRIVVVPSSPVTPARTPTPPPSFDGATSVLSVPSAVMQNVRDMAMRPGPNEASLFRDDLDDEPVSVRRDSLLSVYDKYADTSMESAIRRHEAKSYVRSRSNSPHVELSMGHRRVVSESSARSGSTVEVESNDFEREFINVMDGAVDGGGVLLPGKYYYNSVCDAAPDKTMTFPAGVDSVMTLLNRSDAPILVGVMKEYDKSYAVSVLMDAYNEALAECNAIKRIGMGFQDFKDGNTATMDRTVLQAWVQGLAEVLAQRSLHMNAYAKVMWTLTEHGYELVDNLDALENKFVESHVADLGRLTRPRLAGGPDGYRDRMASRAVKQTISAPVVKMLGNSGFVDDDGGGKGYLVSKAVKERPRITAGQVRMRDMFDRAGMSAEIGNVTYKMQPDSGLRSVWTRPLMKLLGSGNMKIEVGAV